jgi:hypothetical protein
MKTPGHCEFSPNDFTAIAIETSDGRLIHVTGSGLCPTGGWELRLVAANPGIVPHPDDLWLEVRAVPPHGASRVATRTAVEAIIEDTHAEQVTIRFGWRDGFVIPVRTPVGPRAGRRGVRRQADAASGRMAAASAR